MVAEFKRSVLATGWMEALIDEGADPDELPPWSATAAAESRSATTASCCFRSHDEESATAGLHDLRELREGRQQGDRQGGPEGFASVPSATER